MRIGIDFGGVLTATTTPPSQGYLAIPPRPNCREVIREWRQINHTPVLISKAGTDEKESKARLWLAEYNFDELFAAGMEFCRTQKEKASICERYKIDIMIDDTVRQLKLLGGVVTHRVLFDADYAPEDMNYARDWIAAKNIVTSLSSI